MDPTPAAPDDRAQAILDYLDQGLLPLWADRGWDHAGGGFHERLDAEGSPLDLPFRRLMVAGRQLFVFSRGYARFGRPRYAELARQTYDYLTGKFWDDRHGGWFFSLDPSGAPLSRKKDLYGHAFALFGLAHYYAVFGEEAAIEHALRTDEVIRKRLLFESGWFASEAGEDWAIGATELNQNPHMHLLEAYLALFQGTGQALFQRRAEELVELFLGRLFDPGPGVLIEFLDSYGRPHPTRGHELEPGHHYEWYWLLNEFADAVGDRNDCRAAAERLFAWANAHGIDRKQGGVFDQVDPSGRVLTATKRIWPQSERIKADAVRFRQSRNRKDWDELNRQIDFLFKRYLLPGGRWIEVLGADMEPVNRELPASTGYHLVMALEEALKALQR